MIITQWNTMRNAWSGLSTTDPDGIKTWDTSLLELGLLPSDCTAEFASGGVGLGFNLTAPAASDFFFSCRGEWFDVSQPSAAVCRILLNAAGSAATGGAWTSAARRQLLRGSWLYVKRVSDDAICACDTSGIYDLGASEVRALG